MRFAKKSKFGNKKTTIDGYKFDSKWEATVYMQLKMQMKAQKKEDRVVEMRLQPRYVLQEKFEDKTGKKHQAITYVSDFWVKYANGYAEVIDAKGMHTDVYTIKKKLFLHKFPEINFREIQK